MPATRSHGWSSATRWAPRRPISLLNSGSARRRRIASESAAGSFFSTSQAAASCFHNVRHATDPRGDDRPSRSRAPPHKAHAEKDSLSNGLTRSEAPAQRSMTFSYGSMPVKLTVWAGTVGGIISRKAV